MCSLVTYIPVPTARPTVATATWTKINEIPGGTRRYLHLVNEDGSNDFRFALVEPGGTVPTLSTQGRVLAKSGGTFEERPHTGVANADVYVYQASGGNLATLAITEGR